MTDVSSLIDKGEGQHLEFKTSFSEEDEAIQALCAFANAEGGTVLIGVSDDGRVLGVTLGKNTLENLANKLYRSTERPLYVSITTPEVDGKGVVMISVMAPRQGELHYAFGRPYIRVGRTNQMMSPDEQKQRLLGGQPDWSEERDRPRFDVPSRSLTRTEREFQPQWKLQHIAGDYIATIEWRFRGARLQPAMEWRQVSGASLKSYTCAATFDLSLPPGEDELVPADQIGFEVRFHWRGRFRHELHRFSLSKAEVPNKVLWDIGREILPPLYLDE